MRANDCNIKTLQLLMVTINIDIAFALDVNPIKLESLELRTSN